MIPTEDKEKSDSIQKYCSQYDHLNVMDSYLIDQMADESDMTVIRRRSYLRGKFDGGSTGVMIQTGVKPAVRGSQIEAIRANMTEETRIRRVSQINKNHVRSQISSGSILNKKGMTKTEMCILRRNLMVQVFSREDFEQIRANERRYNSLLGKRNGRKLKNITQSEEEKKEDTETMRVACDALRAIFQKYGLPAGRSSERWRN